jgi:hypothetical protein
MRIHSVTQRQKALPVPRELMPHVASNGFVIGTCVFKCLKREWRLDRISEDDFFFVVCIKVVFMGCNLKLYAKDVFMGWNF